MGEQNFFCQNINHFLSFLVFYFLDEKVSNFKIRLEFSSKIIKRRPADFYFKISREKKKWNFRKENKKRQKMDDRDFQVFQVFGGFVYDAIVSRASHFWFNNFLIIFGRKFFYVEIFLRQITILRQKNFYANFFTPKS